MPNGKVIGKPGLFVTSVSALALAMAVQTSSYAQGEESAGVEEIYITSRKRPELLQDVPLSVTAFSQDEMNRRNIQDLEDVARFTAGFNFEDFNGALAAPVIRGTAQQSINDLEQNVASFFDGIYLPRTYLTDLGLNNVSRIEIIKGPQSAKFGRNAYAGAINYIPVKPSEEPIAGYGEATIGSDDLYEANGYISGSTLDGRLRGLVSGSYSTFDGTWENAAPINESDADLGTDGNLGGHERYSFGAVVQVEPHEGIDIELSYNHFDLQDEAVPVGFFAANAGGNNAPGVNNAGVVTASGNRALFSGEIPFLGTPDVDVRAYARAADVDIYRAQFTADVSDAISVSYLFGRIEAENKAIGFSEVNSTNCPFFVPGLCIFQNVPNGELEFNSHEVRVAFDNDGPLTASLGGFFSKLDDDNLFSFALLPPLAAPPTESLVADGPGFVVLTDATTQSKDRSIFGEVQYAAMEDRLRLGFEFRYTSEKKSLTNNQSMLTDSDTFKFFTPRFTIEYDLNDDSLLYVSGAKGVRTGGFNPGAFLPENEVYTEESNWTFEAGSKNTFYDGRLVLNGTLFYIAGKDTQISSADIGNPNPFATNIVLNLGDTRSVGFELDVIARPVEELTVNMALSYVDAQYNDGTVDQRFARLCDDVACPSSGDISGRTLQRASPFQFALGGEWRNELTASGDWAYYVRGDVTYQSEQQAEPMNLSTIPSRFLASATAGVTYGEFDVSLWVRNLFDETYVASSFVTITAGGASYAPVYGAQRAFGLTARANF